MMNCELSVLVLFIVLFGGNGYGLRTVKGDAEAGPSPAAKPPPESSVLSSRTVHTKYGDLRGVIWELDGRHLGSVEVFRGVPYASPPVGNLRFMPPVTGALWRGVKMADRFSPVCPQRLPNISDEQSALKKMPKGRLEYLKRLLPYLQNQSEDCLYLNIYTPTQGKNLIFIIYIKSKYFSR
jgi:carboxylesterase type B